MRSVSVYILVAFTFLSCSVAVQEPENGQELVEAMYKKYKNDWYKTLTFNQATTFYNAEGKVAREQTWLEAMKLPSSLIVKFDSITSGNGILFKNDSMFTMNAGKQFAARKLHHPLLILGFSVYAQAPEKTINALKELKIDFTKMKVGTWQGKENYIIGDENGTHFYIEKERLLFTKLIQKSQNNVFTETQFNKYEPLGKGWVSPEVLFFTSGKMTLKEVYNDIKSPVLKEEIFNPEHFQKSSW